MKSYAERYGHTAQDQEEHDRACDGDAREESMMVPPQIDVALILQQAARE